MNSVPLEVIENESIGEHNLANDFDNLVDKFKIEVKQEPLDYDDVASIIPTAKSEQFVNIFHSSLYCLKKTNENEDVSSEVLTTPKVENELSTELWGEIINSHSNEERQSSKVIITSPQDEQSGMKEFEVAKIDEVQCDTSRQENVNQSEISKVVFPPIMVFVEEGGEPDCSSALSPNGALENYESHLNDFLGLNNPLNGVKETSNPGMANAVRCEETENAFEVTRDSTFSNERIQSSFLTNESCNSSSVLCHNTEASRLSLDHDWENTLSCHICSKKFSSKSGLSKHIRIHTGEKSFSCHICSKKFSNKGHLSTHIRIHTGEKPYSCHICSKKFGQKSGLPRHIRIHTGEKPFSCHICSNNFSTKSELSIHIRFHTGEKPYSCHICSKKFVQNSCLQRHIRIHTGEKSFSCHICSNKFASKSDLSKHIRRSKHIRIHTGEKPFSCHICSKKFSNKSNLSSHILIHTGANHTPPLPVHHHKNTLSSKQI